MKNDIIMVVLDLIVKTIICLDLLNGDEVVGSYGPNNLYIDSDIKILGEIYP